MKIGDEVFVHGYIDEIRKDCIIIRNEGGYFGTVSNEMFYYEEDRNGYGTMSTADTSQTEEADRIPFDPLVEMDIKRMVEARLAQTERTRIECYDGCEWPAGSLQCEGCDRLPPQTEREGE